MLNTAFSPWPSYTAEEAQAVSRVLLSNRVNYWTGPECRYFEQEFAQWVGVAHAVAVVNGTLALELALRALGVGAGDEVVVTPRSFVASATCVLNVGATPVFADVDRDSQNITARTIERVLTPRTRAVICVHLAGMPCDMNPIMSLADAHGLKVVEDCAQAHGARYRGRMVGGLGHIGAWSFCQDKIMTTGGEGGMVTTDDPELSERMWSYKDHGKSWSAVQDKHPPPGYRWLHDSVGSNMRMIEVQAVIGRMQLLRMPAWHARRTQHAERIRDACRTSAALRVPANSTDAQHAYYRCYAFVEPEQLKAGWNRDRIVAEIGNHGVPCFQGACPEIYRENVFVSRGLVPPAPLPIARELGESSIAFLVHPTLTDSEIDKTCDVLRQVMARASVAA
jgi:dTDP-4-amino-4,6-dideoxygalactose transaminase